MKKICCYMVDTYTGYVGSHCCCATNITQAVNAQLIYISLGTEQFIGIRYTEKYNRYPTCCFTTGDPSPTGKK